MVKVIKKFVVNDVLHWAWKLFPLVFMCGVLWMKVDSVQQQVGELTKRVGALEKCLMQYKGIK